MPEESFQKSWDSFNNAKINRRKSLSWLKEWVVSWAKFIADVLKWTYRWIDWQDKVIWKKIENRWKMTSSKFKNFLKDNIIKISIVLSLASVWWWIAIHESWKERKQEKEEIFVEDERIRSIEEEQALLKALFEKEDIIKDLGWSWASKQQMRKNRYLWNDNDRNKDYDWMWQRKKVIEWFCRMVESWDLEMILKKAEEAWVPRQCVFLALAESWREAWANSWKAEWYWQFTGQSAIDFWLNTDGNDNRNDPVKSTEAAMRHLTANYDIVCNYNKELWYNLSESDKRYLAFSMYNLSPKKIRKWMEACKWIINEYSIKQKNKENKKYMPRILWIQDALKDIFEKHNYNINQVRLSIWTKTAWDIMYDEYRTKIFVNKEQQIAELETIKDEYTNEYQNQLITEKYYNWAINVIEKEILRVQSSN